MSDVISLRYPSAARVEGYGTITLSCTPIACGRCGPTVLPLRRRSA
jgi:hypothetical protein